MRREGCVRRAFPRHTPSLNKERKEGKKSVFLATAADPLAYSTHRSDSLPLFKQASWMKKNLQSTFLAAPLAPSFAATKSPERSGCPSLKLSGSETELLMRWWSARTVGLELGLEQQKVMSTLSLHIMGRPEASSESKNCKSSDTAHPCPVVAVRSQHSPPSPASSLPTGSGHSPG